MYTENQSWGAGIGHLGIWKDDHIRYRGVAGYASVNLAYYRTTIDGDPGRGVDFNLQGLGLLQSLVFRIQESRFYAGLEYMYFGAETKFDVQTHIRDLPPIESKGSDGGLGALIQYDSWDNIFTPNRGIRAGVL